MKRCFVICLLPVLLGSLILIHLGRKKEGLEVTLAEVNRRVGHGFRPRREKIRSRISRRMYLEGLSFPKSLLEEVKEISHLSRDEVMVLAEEILARGMVAKMEAQGVSSRAIVSLAIELDPAWFLQKVGKREKGEDYYWRTRNESALAFERYLRQDPERALEWYEKGAEERRFEYFDTSSLERSAVGELLKSDPMRALETMDANYLRGRDDPISIYFRLETEDQLLKCVDALALFEEGAKRGWLERFVASETYRIGGVEELRKLIDSGSLEGRGDLGKYEILDRIGYVVQSEKGMRDLLELTRDAPEAVRDEIVGTAVGRWGYEDALAAEEFVLALSSGKARELGLERLIQVKGKYDPEGAFELLGRLENDERRDVLRRELSAVWGE